MLYPIIATLILIGPSLWLMLAIEREAEYFSGERLSVWRRIWIPLPIFCFLVGNLDGVLSLVSYLEAHPGAAPFRYHVHQAWNADRFYHVGWLVLALLPFILAPVPWQGFRLLLATWGGHFFWLIFPFAPWLLASGVPLKG